MSSDIRSCTPSEGNTTSFKCFTLSFERDCIKEAPLTIVFATSIDNIDNLFPFVTTPGAKTKLPSISTAFPKPALTFVDFVDLDIFNETLANLGIPSSSSNTYEPAFISGKGNGSLKVWLSSSSILPLSISSADLELLPPIFSLN
ncbi:hypothetical protein HanPSC8_Chr11g0453261 [Helianthus annuus]|nr:hypothetical protein HanPSC8_Chr11g0453261 [Helianthus annuus]